MQKEQLGHNGVCDLVVHLRAQEHDAVLEQAAVDVHRPLFAAALLDDVGNQGHGVGFFSGWRNGRRWAQSFSCSSGSTGGFVSTYYQRQTESEGVSRVAGNAYVLEHRQLRGQLIEAAIYYEPVIDTANSEPMTQSTEAEIELEAKTATLSIGLSVLSSPKPATSSSTATATSTTGYSNMTTPLVKSDELVYISRDFDRDLFKPDGKKASDHSKAKPASKAQLEALGKYLGSYERAALKLYEVANLSQLTAQQADGLIKHTQGNNPELTNHLNRLSMELREKAERAAQAREAANQAQRDYEAGQALKNERLKLYGNELTEAEQGERVRLLRASRRDKAPAELRARGKKLVELEADTSLTTGERLSKLLELING